MAIESEIKRGLGMLGRTSAEAGVAQEPLLEGRDRALEAVKRSTVVVRLWEEKTIEAYPGSVGSEERTEVLPVGHASGFFIEGGLIMTNAHVVEDVLNGMNYSITLSSGKQVPAAVTYIDPVRDIGILKPVLADEDIPPPALKFASPSTLKLQQPIYAIGTPLDTVFEKLAIPGEIIKLPEEPKPGDSKGDAEAKRAVIHTANTMGGMSGGPLIAFDEQTGEAVVVGIVMGGYYNPLRPQQGSLDRAASVEDFRVIAEHAEFFAATMALMRVTEAARAANHLPEGLAGKGPVALFAGFILPTFRSLFEAYCDARGYAPEEKTLVQAQILGDEGMQAMLKASIGGGPLIFREDMQTINQLMSTTFGVVLYSEAEMKSALSVADFQKEPEPEREAA